MEPLEKGFGIAGRKLRIDVGGLSGDPRPKHPYGRQVTFNPFDQGLSKD